MKESLNWLDIWMVVGLDETAVETHSGTYDFIYWNREAKQILEQKGAAVSYREKPGDHVWGLWQKELPDGLRHFFPAPHL